MAAAGGSFIAATQEMAAKKEKEGSDRPRTLSRGVVSNGCSVLNGNMSEGKGKYAGGT